VRRRQRPLQHDHREQRRHQQLRLVADLLAAAAVSALDSKRAEVWPVACHAVRRAGEAECACGGPPGRLRRRGC
jgi:hypothetical protein